MSLAQTTTPIYSREQILIPVAFPDILKNYSKYIIKNQPSDIVTASAEYFANLSRQQALGRQVHVSEISREQLETLYLLFQGKSTKLTRNAIGTIAQESLLSVTTVDDIYQVGSWPEGVSISWIEFWSLCCSVAAGTLQATLLLMVDILVSNNSLPSSVLSQAIQFLAKAEGSVAIDRITLCVAELTIDGETISETKAIDSITKLCANP